LAKEGVYKQFLLEIPETFLKLLLMAGMVLLFFIMKEREVRGKQTLLQKLIKIFKLKKN
jgi:hypothetical protein